MPSGIVGQKTSDPRFFSSFYRRHRINIIVHVKHPLAERRPIRIKDLEGQRVVLRTGGGFNRSTKEAGIKIEAVLETSSLEGVVADVMQNIDIGSLSDSGIAGIKAINPSIRVTDLDMFTEAHVVCLAQRRDRPLIASLLRHAAPCAHPAS